MPLRAGTILGSYEILALIGVGGMGEVYSASDTKLGRQAAIKVLPEALAQDPERLARFQREARMLAALNHPAVATIHGLEQCDGVHYLVMELVPGDTLAQVIARGPLPLAEALNISAQIAEALQAAHSKGIIHRDLKPANIKVTPDGRVKVLDFGLAKAFEPSAASTDALRDDTLTIHEDPTRVGQILGTPAYMGPEQVRGLPLDQRADIWAFGCVVFELLSGRPPFRGQSMGDTFANILQQEPDWQALPASTPPHVRALLKSCFEKDPNQRLNDISEVRRQFEESPAKTPAPPERRSNNVFAITAAVAVAIISILAAGVGFNVAGLRDRLLGASSPSAIRAIAVLPLENQSNDPGQQYFADGFTDALITDLSKLQALKVISRTSAMQYKSTKKATREIARELGVDAVVEGAVLTEDGKVRITVNLIRASTDASLWTESYVRDLKDVLSLQGDVARVIAGQIRLALTPDEQTRLAAARTVDPELYRLYLKANFAFNQDSVPSRRESIQLFKEVTEKDPDSAPAWAGLALANASLGRFYDEPHKVMPEARKAALMAIKLDKNLSEAYTALATVKLQYDWDWEGANQDLQHAIQLNHSSADAHDLYA
ncbi:MAG TPA: protein kinase, partial [Bryobacteraceae bacterium]